MNNRTIRMADRKWLEEDIDDPLSYTERVSWGKFLLVPVFVLSFAVLALAASFLLGMSLIVVFVYSFGLMSVVAVIFLLKELWHSLSQ